MALRMLARLSRRRVATVIDISFIAIAFAVVAGTAWILTSTRNTLLKQYQDRLDEIASSVAGAIANERSGFKEQLHRLGYQPLRPLRIEKPIRYWYETDACFEQSPVCTLQFVDANGQLHLEVCATVDEERRYLTLFGSFSANAVSPYIIGDVATLPGADQIRIQLGDGPAPVRLIVLPSKPKEKASAPGGAPSLSTPAIIGTTQTPDAVPVFVGKENASSPSGAPSLSTPAIIGATQTPDAVPVFVGIEIPKATYKITAYEATADWTLRKPDKKNAERKISNAPGVDGTIFQKASGPLNFAFALKIDLPKIDQAFRTQPMKELAKLPIRLQITSSAGGGQGRVVAATVSGDGVTETKGRVIPVIEQQTIRNLDDNEIVEIGPNTNTPGTESNIWTVLARASSVGLLSDESGGIATKAVQMLFPEQATAVKEKYAKDYSLRVSGVPYKQVQTWRSFASSLLQGAAYLALAVAVLWWTVRMLTVRRIERLTAEVNRLARAEGSNSEDWFKRTYAFEAARGRDEIGVLSRTFHTLLERIREDDQRVVHEANARIEQERARIESEKKRLRDIGHEINSPLQSLQNIVTKNDEAWPHVERIRRTVKANFGMGGTETVLRIEEAEIEEIDLNQALAAIPKNAGHRGIGNVLFSGTGHVTCALVDPLLLDSVLDSLLNNAARFRTADTPIELLLLENIEDKVVIIEVRNQGPVIAIEMLDSIFEYGATSDTSGEHLGLGLYAARGYLAKMNGHIAVRNLADPEGVAFEIKVPSCSSLIRTAKPS